MAFNKKNMLDISLSKVEHPSVRAAKKEPKLRIIGLVILIIFFIFSIYGSILIGNPYGVVSFFILVLASGLLVRIVFRKEYQLYKKGKTEEVSKWNMYLKLMLLVLIGYPLLSIPRYSAGTPLKTLLDGYAALIAAFGTLGILSRIFVLNKKPKLGFKLTYTLIILASGGASGLIFIIFRMIG